MSREPERAAPWAVLGVETAFSTPWFEIRRYRCRTPLGRDVPAYYVHEAPDSVLCVCVTTDGFVLLQREYRLPIGVSLDFPGGALQDGESPARAALRELREEAGYTGSEPRLLATLHKDPAFSRAKVHIFLIEDAAADGTPRIEEDIELIRVRPHEVMNAVDRGTLACCFCVAAALKASRHLGW